MHSGTEVIEVIKCSQMAEYCSNTAGVKTICWPDNSTAAVLLSVLPAAGEGQLKRCSVTHLTQFSISALNVFVRTCGEQKRTGRRLDVNHRKLVRWSLDVLHRPGIDTARWRCVVFQKCRRSRSEQNTAGGRRIPAAVNTMCLAGTC